MLAQPRFAFLGTGVCSTFVARSSIIRPQPEPMHPYATLHIPICAYTPSPFGPADVSHSIARFLKAGYLRDPSDTQGTWTDCRHALGGLYRKN